MQMAYYLTLTIHIQVISKYIFDDMVFIRPKLRKVGHDLDLKFSL